MSTTPTERARALALQVRSLEAPSGVFVVEAKWLDEVATTLEEMAATLATAEKERDEARAALATTGRVLSANGCDCDCDHHPEEHSDECELCLACRIGAALCGEVKG